MICRFDQLADWFESLADILHWNLRKPQSKLTNEQRNPNDDDLFNSSEDTKSDDHGRSSSSASTSEISVDSEI